MAAGLVAPGASTNASELGFSRLALYYRLHTRGCDDRWSAMPRSTSTQRGSPPRSCLTRGKKDMATWVDTASHIKSKFKVRDSDGVLVLSFKFNDGRTQLVLVSHGQTGDGADWATVESAIGKIGEVDVSKALKRVGSMVCGGLSSTGEYVTLRHAVPLANLDANEIETPIGMIVSSADDLEQELTGKDDL